MLNLNYPSTRLRRNRYSQQIRNLVAENNITANDLVYPMFILDGKQRLEPIESMPNQFRMSIDFLLKTVESVVRLGINAIAIFPIVESIKDNQGSESFNENGLVQRATKIVKQNFPNILVFTDVALDPYTIHGQDGIIDDNGYIQNDVTTNILVKQALSQAQAGADFVCPSDMMDGRIGAIRQALEQNQFHNTGIMSYAAKYSSKYYCPFRDAVGSSSNLGKSNKHNYQMNPANSDEALYEVAQDIQEGADIVMVKPGLPYLDIIARIKQEFKFPTAAYHVSGEYAMLKAAAEKNWLDYESTLLETMLCFKRAGADIIWSYAALDVINILYKG